ncbi:MAG: protein-L-isoaspartate(D-aspartate) O-methyltransferase [Planctomycetaceae bacterium]
MQTFSQIPGSIVRSCSSAILIVTLLIAMAQSASAQGRNALAAEREKMVTENIASEGVTNERVLDSMRTVPRHMFVRPELRRMAYLDQALDLGFKQTISPPSIVAYMTQTLDPQPTDVVLEIGTGSGYQAAVLSSLVKDVYTIEIVEPLGKRAAATLKMLDYKNVHCLIGDGYKGWPEHAPFDKIIVTCSPENVPEPLVEQLKEGGKMIIPLGERYQQVFHLLEKKDGKLEQKKLIPTLFVPMTGKSEELREVQPDPLHPKIVNGGFEQSTLIEGQADGWHYHRRGTLKQDNAPEGMQYICFENHEAGRTAHALQAAAIDGSVIGELKFSCRVKANGIHQGATTHDRPGCVIHFFDGKRLPIGVASAGPWTADQEWTKFSQTINVPAAAREMIFQVGLNGATGTLCVDDMEIRGVPRLAK